MKKQLQILNGLALLLTITINYLSNTGIFNGNTIASVSKQYNNLFTPAGYAFSIWGLIYLGMLGFVIYFGRSLFISVTKEDKSVEQIGWWFIISCLANASWVLLWIYDYILLSVLIMLLLLFSLLKIVVNLKMELHNVPFKKFLFLWWPFCFYSGWVSVALIANIAAYLKKIEWNGFGISESIWTVVLIVLAAGINVFMIWNRNMREFALVGVWALIAIAVANKSGDMMVYWSASSMALLLLVMISIHGFQNRETNPFTHRMKE
ncbi:MAG TPA: hypothetical protein VK050_05750 [Flavobacteriaceae bacterium]|nr:hypothetical protein [Flavobacteriaceae bacterium]